MVKFLVEDSISGNFQIQDRIVFQLFKNENDNFGTKKQCKQKINEIEEELTPVKAVPKKKSKNEEHVDQEDNDRSMQSSEFDDKVEEEIIDIKKNQTKLVDRVNLLEF
jgi:hypothetical protein